MFEVDDKHTPTALHAATLATRLTIMCLLSLLLLNKAIAAELPPQLFYPGLFPAALFTMISLSLLLPSSRFLSLARCLCRILFAPFSPVTFWDSFIADVITSLAKPLIDTAYAFCYVFTLEWLSPVHIDGQETCYNSSLLQDYLTPAICAIPLWCRSVSPPPRFLLRSNAEGLPHPCPPSLGQLTTSPFLPSPSPPPSPPSSPSPSPSPSLLRFMQCLRVYLDSGKRMPALPNALKYAVSLNVVLFGTLHKSVVTSFAAETAWIQVGVKHAPPLLTAWLAVAHSCFYPSSLQVAETLKDLKEATPPLRVGSRKPQRSVPFVFSHP